MAKEVGERRAKTQWIIKLAIAKERLTERGQHCKMAVDNVPRIGERHRKCTVRQGR